MDRMEEDDGSRCDKKSETFRVDLFFPSCVVSTLVEIVRLQSIIVTISCIKNEFEIGVCL